MTITAVGDSVFKLNDVNAEPTNSNKAPGGADEEIDLVACEGPDYSHEVGSVASKHWSMMYHFSSATPVGPGCRSGIRCCSFHDAF